MHFPLDNSDCRVETTCPLVQVVKSIFPLVSCRQYCIGHDCLLVRVDIARFRGSDSGVRHEVREREKHLPHPSLQCRRILGGQNLVRVRIVVAATMVLSRAKTFARPKKTPALQANHTPSLFFFFCSHLFPHEK